VAWACPEQSERVCREPPASDHRTTRYDRSATCRKGRSPFRLFGTSAAEAACASGSCGSPVPRAIPLPSRRFVSLWQPRSSSRLRDRRPVGGENPVRQVRDLSQGAQPLPPPRPAPTTLPVAWVCRERSRERLPDNAVRQVRDLSQGAQPLWSLRYLRCRSRLRKRVLWEPGPPGDPAPLASLCLALAAAQLEPPARPPPGGRREPGTTEPALSVAEGSATCRTGPSPFRSSVAPLPKPPARPPPRGRREPGTTGPRRLGPMAAVAGKALATCPSRRRRLSVGQERQLLPLAHHPPEDPSRNCKGGRRHARPTSCHSPVRQVRGLSRPWYDRSATCRKGRSPFPLPAPRQALSQSRGPALSGANGSVASPQRATTRVGTLCVRFTSGQLAPAVRQARDLSRPRYDRACPERSRRVRDLSQGAQPLSSLRYLRCRSRLRDRRPVGGENPVRQVRDLSQGAQPLSSLRYLRCRSRLRDRRRAGGDPTSSSRPAPRPPRACPEATTPSVPSLKWLYNERP